MECTAHAVYLVFFTIIYNTPGQNVQNHLKLHIM
jgi:hypothetical protein